MNGALEALNSMHDGVLTVDLASRIIYMNAAAERITGWSLQEAIGQPSHTIFNIINSVTREVDWEPLHAVLQDAEPYSLLPQSLIVRKDGIETPVEDSATPIFDADGRVSGAAVVFRDVGHTRLLLMNALHCAKHDALTTLPNRAFLFERLKTIFSDPQELAETTCLLYMDVDNFKEINDAFGHNTGDFVLQVVAKRIAKCLRKGDVVCRMGGDEFVVLVTHVSETKAIQGIVNKLLGSLREASVIEGKQIITAVSIGVAFGHIGSTAQALVEDADHAMYTAKAAGGNIARWFTQDMRSKLRTQTDFEANLEAALQEDRFTVLYQPIVDLRTGKIVGAEALLRLRSTDSVLLNPSSFIHIAERTGQIVAIGQVIVRTVLKQQQAWRKAGFHLRVSVNVSPYEMTHPEYLATFDTMLLEGLFEAGSLLLEFTESGSLQTDHHRELLAVLKRRGLLLGIDDFGTGFSNLDYLRRFPIDVIKIDQAFLQHIEKGPQDATLLRAIINMGRSLRLAVIAEGIETEEQLAFLRDASCPYGQGFLFGPGVVPEDLFARWATV